MKSGLPRTEVILFEGGIPDGDIAYTLTGGITGTVTPEANSVSASITITAPQNTLANGSLTGFRELNWSYLSGGQTVSGSTRWTLEGTIPFGVSEDGVRQKLGLEELTNEEIPLIKGYLEFQNKLGASTLAALESTSDYNQVLLIDAIEASAALYLLPTLQVRVAKTETSGTNTYTRQNIDWAMLEARLQAYVSKATTALSSTTTSVFSLFSVTEAVSLFPDG